MYHNKPALLLYFLYMLIGFGRAITSNLGLRDDLVRGLIWPLSLVVNLWLIFDRIARGSFKVIDSRKD